MHIHCGPMARNYDYSKAWMQSRAGDWVWAKTQYEMGIMPVKTIAGNIGVKPITMSCRAIRDKWVRVPKLMEKVKAERVGLQAKKESSLKQIYELEVIKITAEMQSHALTSHRKDIKKARELAAKLLDELESVSGDPQLMKNLCEMVANPQNASEDKLREAFTRAVSLGERSNTLAKLGGTLKVLIALERQALGIQGELEDAESERPKSEVVKGLDKIMDKFNAVLALQAPPADTSAATPTKEPEIIIDVSVVNTPAAP